MANRILVAEDEAIIALDLKEKLETLGYTVVDVAASGEDACTLADKHRPDLVLMDIMMPGRMDGTAAATCIRERFSIPSVYLTAFATDAVVARAKTAGAYGYIIKPFSQNQLKATIDIALTRSRLDQALRISEARYRAIVENVDDFILRLAPDFSIIFSNRAFNRWAQQQPGGGTPDTQWARSFPMVEQCLRRESNRIQETQEVVFQSCTIPGPGKRERHYHWEFKGIFDAAQLTEYQLVGRDVTTFERVQSDLCDINCELEEILRDRVAAINELQFQLVEAETASNILVRKLLNQRQPEAAPPYRQIADQLAPYIEKMRDSKRIAILLEKVGDVGITVNTLPEAGQKDSSHISHRLRILTPIELEVANMIREGLLSKEIADQLCISIRTVETHRLNIRKKLGLCNAATQLRQFLITEC
ncbi:MAG: response regulator [Pseudomonadota bacterium]